MGTDTSILDTFRANFAKAANQIILLGNAKESKKECGIAEYLLLFEEESVDEKDEPSDNTQGKTNLYEKKFLLFIIQ